MSDPLAINEDAGDGTGTETMLPHQDPEACASAIPPLLRTDAILPKTGVLVKYKTALFFDIVKWISEIHAPAGARSWKENRLCTH